MRRAFGALLIDDKDNLRALAQHDMGDGGDEGVAAELAVDDGGLDAAADVEGEARVRFSGGDVLHFERRFERGVRRDGDVVAVGEEGGVDRADRIVIAAQGERPRECAVLKLGGKRGDRDAFRRFDRLRLAFEQAQQRAAVDQRAEHRHAQIAACRDLPQQRAQVRIVPSLDAARRQAEKLQLLHRPVAGA